MLRRGDARSRTHDKRRAGRPPSKPALNLRNPDPMTQVANSLQQETSMNQPLEASPAEAVRLSITPGGDPGNGETCK